MPSSAPAAAGHLTLFLGAIVLVGYLCALVADDAPAESFASLYTVYTASLLLLAGCALPPPAV